MSLKETIQQDLKEALKGKKEAEVSCLRQVLAAVLNKEKEKRFRLLKEKPDTKEEDLLKESALTEDEFQSVISSEAKKRRESITEFERGQRQELAQKEKDELAVLEKYLPEQMSEEYLQKMVKEAISKTGAQSQKDIGKVMAELVPKTKGRVDGSLLSKTVKDLLAQ